MSGIYDFNIPAGQSQRFSVVGNKAKIIQASQASGLRVRVDGGDAYTCLEGQGLRMPDGRSFSDVTIFNPGSNAQIGYVFIGDAAFEDTRITGNVRIVDEITDALTYLSFAPSFAIKAISYDTLVAAATNVRGIILRGWSTQVTPGAGGNSILSLVAAKSVPVDYTTPAQRYVISGTNLSAGSQTLSDSKINKLLPPGWGLYVGTATTTTAAVLLNASVNYEVL